MTKDLLKLITPSHFRELIKEGISLDLLYLLSIIKEGRDLSQFRSRKEQALLQSLQRRFLVTEDKKLTLEGEKVFTFLSIDGDVEGYLRPEIADDGFELFWKTYPSTDAVIDKGKVVLKPARSLKGDKKEAAQLYRQILGEGEFTAAQILKALEYEVKMKVETSLKIRENKMKYMQNSSTWLRQRTFAQFIAVSELDNQSTKSAGAVDI
jgi:hypothetical protein